MWSLSPPAAVRPNVIAASAVPRLQWQRAGSPRRHQVEAFIRAVYRARYGTEWRHFAPPLVSGHDEHGDGVAVAGYPDADSGPLYLERHLSGPVVGSFFKHRRSQAAPATQPATPGPSS